MAKTFNELEVGDRVECHAKIIALYKHDEKHDPPKWFLIGLHDGTKTLRMFLNDMTDLNVLDVVKIDFTVKEGKPYNGMPQHAYTIHSITRKESIPQEKSLPKSKYTIDDIMEYLQDYDRRFKEFVNEVMTALKKEGG